MRAYAHSVAANGQSPLSGAPAAAMPAPSARECTMTPSGGNHEVIVGTGCDLVPVDRLRAACERHPSMLDRLFSPLEQSGADAADARRWERLAGVFAAKEAALKALGTGMRVAFRDVEVHHDAMGRPLLALRGEAELVAARIGAGRVHVSISHSGGFAMATVIAET